LNPFVQMTRQPDAVAYIYKCDTCLKVSSREECCGKPSQVVGTSRVWKPQSAHPIVEESSGVESGLRGYDLDGVLSVGITPVKPYVIISGRLVDETEKTQVEFADQIKNSEGIYLRPEGAYGDHISAGEWKAKIITELGVTAFYEDHPVQAEIIRQKCPSCQLYMVTDGPEIALGGLFYNSERWLPKYFKDILALNYLKSRIHLRFVITKSDDSTEKMVDEFLLQHGSEYASAIVKKRGRTSAENHYMYDKISNVVDSWETLRLASAPYDLLVVEHDQGLPTDALTRLLKMRKNGANICSGLSLVAGGQMHWTLADGSVLRIDGLPNLTAYSEISGGGGELRSICSHTPTFHLIYLAKEFTNKTFQIGATSFGVVLLGREVLNRVAFTYTKHYTQDMWYCIQARKAGFKIVVDTGLWCDHHHYDYARWMDAKGRMFIYLRGGFEVGPRDGQKLSVMFPGVVGMVIPKEEVERQNVPIHKIVVDKVDWE
jgi:hypothetical protein